MTGVKNREPGTGNGEPGTGNRERGTGNRERGFTVVELLIVVAIFSIASISIVSTYINFTRLHRRVANAETLGQDLRFTMELLVRAARNNTVVYPALPASLSKPVGTLNLISSAGTPVSFRRWGYAEIGSPCLPLKADCLALSFDNGATWTAITGKNVNIDRFDAYVTPLQNPFEAVGFAYNNNDQPRVTIVMDATYKNVVAQEQAKLSVQTSVSSRLYVR
ncbi:hypothetical protein A3E39_04825 [Candidatus Uhrbacteria bacterium RIFCSPHIGHO2_12_FULL_60_25]|uniref:Prepilin-type N-terminal cleavage/methylation domain-containing protein n=1 Tax=Candidatus Uhrbacteria bacterium RIFCSPHIGHO2_12_FULL_60_25 TaxID=1802399 RepID=A0A1F7ULQ5_9BACT|nr:MAG: hypothetical protein A3E39_04825 [Candidatus Uhrbacteria bacterium RIFCSPHIGHO2_12_FULL_60_25]